jgi:hypothetical protein
MCPEKRLFCLLCLCATVTAEPQTRISPPPQPVPTIVFKVLHVYDSPGTWSGIEEFDQPIDAEVISTSSGGFRIGQRLTFGIPLVYPSKLFDRKTVSLNPLYIAPRKHFRGHDRGGCFFPPHLLHLSDSGVTVRTETSGYTLDASCIEPLGE